MPNTLTPSKIRKARALIRRKRREAEQLREAIPLLRARGLNLAADVLEREQRWRGGA